MSETPQEHLADAVGRFFAQLGADRDGGIQLIRRREDAYQAIALVEGVAGPGAFGHLRTAIACAASVWAAKQMAPAEFRERWSASLVAIEEILEVEMDRLFQAAAVSKSEAA